jgi:hypothetical protein
MNNSKAIQSANLHAATTHAKAKADAIDGKPDPAAIPPWPWVVHEERFVAAADGSPVVNMCHPNKAVAKTIAPLLAAAPELLAALEEARDALRELSRHDSGVFGGDAPEFNEDGYGYLACRAIDRAISKAKGHL